MSSSQETKPKEQIDHEHDNNISTWFDEEQQNKNKRKRSWKDFKVLSSFYNNQQRLSL